MADELKAKIGLDEKSAKAFISDVKSTVDDAQKEAGTVNVKVGSNAEAQLGGVSDAMSEAASGADDLKSRLSGALNEIGAAAESLGSKILIVGAALGAALGLASKNAADDEAALARLETTFGANAAAAAEFSESLAKANDALQVGDIQNFLSEARSLAGSMGLAGDEALKFSTDFLLLTDALSRSRKISADEAFQQLETAIKRGGPAAAKLGFALDDLTVRQEAMRQGLISEGQTLNATEEQMVRYGLVLAELPGIQNKANSSAQTFGESVQKLVSQLSELGGEVGKSVNEVLGPLVVKLTEMVKAVKEWVALNPNFSKGLLAVAFALGVVGTAIGIISSFIGAAKIISTIAGAFSLLSGSGAGAGAAIAAANVPLAAMIAKIVAAAGPIGLIVTLLGLLAFTASKTAEKFEESQKIISQGKVDLDNFSKSTRASIRALNPDALEKYGKATGKTGDALSSAGVEATRYLATIQRTVKGQEEQNQVVGEFNRLLATGLQPQQAFTQAMNEQSRVLFLVERGSKRTAEETDELISAMEKMPAAVQKQLGVEGELIALQEKKAKLSEAQTKAIEDLKEKELAALNEVAEAAVKRTESIEDDIKLIRERADAEKASFGGSDNFKKQASEVIDRTTDTKEQGIRAEADAKTQEKIREEQKKTEAEIKDSTKASVQAELELQQQRADATATLEDDIEVLEKRAELEKSNLKDVLSKALIEKKFQIEREKLEEKFAQAQTERIEETKKGAVEAELALADGRAKATDGLQDDIAVLKARQALEIEEAQKRLASEEEIQNLVQKHHAQRLKFIEDESRTRLKALADEKKARAASVDAFADKGADAKLRKEGKEGLSDVKQTAKEANEVAKNVDTDASLTKFKLGLKDANDAVVQSQQERQAAAEKEAKDARADFQKQKAAKGGFASSKERNAVEAEVLELEAKAAAEGEKTNEVIAERTRLEAESLKIAQAALAANQKADAEKLAGVETPEAKAAAEKAAMEAGLANPADAAEAAEPPDPNTSILTQILTAVTGILTAIQTTGQAALAVGGEVAGEAGAAAEDFAEQTGINDALNAFGNEHAAANEALSAFGEVVVEKLTEAAAELRFVREDLTALTKRVADINFSQVPDQEAVDRAEGRAAMGSE